MAQLLRQRCAIYEALTGGYSMSYLRYKEDISIIP
uniref:Uncharacterized protein n=1 Tax=Anguilla anguilla TaxID=7936 RepID=A0A0E9QV62_ANGAN